MSQFFARPAYPVSEQLFGAARITQLIGLGFGVGVGLRSRCSVSDLLPGPWLQVFFERTIDKFLDRAASKYNEHLLL